VGVNVDVGVKVGLGVAVQAEAVIVALCSGDGPQEATSRVTTRKILSRTNSDFMIFSFLGNEHRIIGQND
jgi:hypothetical protein